MSDQKVSLEAPSRRYFTQLPNLIDDSDLDPYEFRLLAHYYRVGDCYEGTRTTAEKCQMSTKAVSIKRRSLEAKGWIKLVEPTPGTNETIKITVLDKWPENMRHYSGGGVTEGNEGVTQGNTSVTSGNGGVTQGNKRITIQEDHSKKIKDSARSAPTPETPPKAQKKLPQIPEPLASSPAFTAAWQEWQDYHRQDRRKALSARSMSLQLKDCLAWGEARAVAAITHSIKSNYQGLYEPKSNGKAQAAPQVLQAAPKGEARPQVITDEIRRKMDKVFGGLPS